MQNAGAPEREYFLGLKVLFGLLILMILLSIRATAQNAITLKQAINNGLSNRKNIAASKLDIDIRKLQTQTLYRKYLPQISAEYTYLYNPILQTSILPIGIFPWRDETFASYAKIPDRLLFVSIFVKVW